MKKLPAQFLALALLIAVLVGATEVSARLSNGTGGGGGSSGISAVVDDTAPVLGGSLDAGGFDITNLDDLLSNAGGIINFDSGDLTLTHSSNALTVAGGDFFVPTEAYDATGWNGDNSVPTKDAVRDKFESFAPAGTVVGYFASSTSNAYIHQIPLTSGDVVQVVATTERDDSCGNASDETQVAFRYNLGGAGSTTPNSIQIGGSAGNGCSGAMAWSYTASGSTNLSLALETTQASTDLNSLLVQVINN